MALADRWHRWSFNVFGDLQSAQVKAVGTEEPEQSDDDQIDRNNIIKEPGYHENQNAGDE